MNKAVDILVPKLHTQMLYKALTKDFILVNSEHYPMINPKDLIDAEKTVSVSRLPQLIIGMQMS